MGRKVLDITGERYGRLVALSFSHTKGGKTLWLCLCDCGITHTVSLSSLRKGSCKSCGCLRLRNITGTRYGRLVALRFSHRIKGCAVWICMCDCGTSSTTRLGALTSGRTRS